MVHGVKHCKIMKQSNLCIYCVIKETLVLSHSVHILVFACLTNRNGCLRGCDRNFNIGCFVLTVRNNFQTMHGENPH